MNASMACPVIPGCAAIGLGPIAARAAEDRIRAANSNKLSRFREANEPGMLSLSHARRAPISVPETVPIANPIIVIPARLAATRLPHKPLAEIAGTPMIVHVWRRAVAADAGPVVVACGDAAIVDVIERAGGRALLTDPALPTGSDRIHAAVTALDPEGSHDAVINVQGDMPMLDPAAIRT